MLLISIRIDGEIHSGMPDSGIPHPQVTVKSAGEFSFLYELLMEPAAFLQGAGTVSVAFVDHHVICFNFSQEVTHEAPPQAAFWWRPSLRRTFPGLHRSKHPGMPE